jgi:ABC-type lipoprotein release transport system permease subunit
VPALRYALRNLLRNPRRTAITGAAVAFSTAVLIVSVALMEGMRADAVHNATAAVLGEVQVHAPGYRATRAIGDVIQQPNRVLAAAERDGLDAVVRAYGDGLAALGTRSAGARFWGVDPAAERRAFELHQQVAVGRFLGEGGAHAGERAPAVLGAKLARALHARPGSELAAIVEGARGEIGTSLLEVVGVLKAVGADLDRSAVILSRADFDRLFGTSAPVHEIALTSHGRLPATAVAAAVRPAAADAEVLTWRGLVPALAEMVDLFGGFAWLTGVVFLASAALGVMNGMLMSTFERFHEFGVVKALGASRLRVVRDVAAEALLLGLAAAGVGGAVGLAGALWLARHGIDLGGRDLLFAGVAFNAVWRADLSFAGVAWPVGATWATCVLAALYPAVKAARLDPAAALMRP